MAAWFMGRKRRTDRFWTASLPAEMPDFALRVGDSTLSPERQRIRVVLITGPRQFVARPPRWTDHLWMIFARDAQLLGPQRKD
jgi:hypothetical protein